MKKPPLYINIKGRLMDFSTAKVMGILNITPDSFYSDSRCFDEELIRKRAKKIIADGADIIDIGGCSTRPGFNLVSAEEEWARVERGCRIVRGLSPEIPISVDTFRASVALKAVSEFEIDIINDISGGEDPDMWDVPAKYKVAYVLTHNRGENLPCYTDITANVITELSKKVNILHKMGVNDVIIDPGFGFAKTSEENFQLFSELNEIARMGLPLMVGISRKSMIYKTLDISPEESLTGTIALNTLVLQKGADILRVHDVGEAVDVITLYSMIKKFAV